MKKFKLISLAGILVIFALTTLLPGGFFIPKAQAWFGGNHNSVATKIPTILKNDGHSDYAKILEKYMYHFKIGSKKPDSWSTTTKSKIWRLMGYELSQTSAEHFYDPASGRGLPGFRSAAQKSDEYFNIAVSRWKENKKEEAIQWLGMTCHFAQDATVPQHATRNLVQVVQGHNQYERFILQNGPRYYVNSGGYYNISTTSQLVKRNAAEAKKYRQYVDGKSWPKRDDHNKTTYALFPMAQRSTAGIVGLFMKKTNAAQDLVKKKTIKKTRPKQVTPVQKEVPKSKSKQDSVKPKPKLDVRGITKGTFNLIDLFTRKLGSDKKIPIVYGNDGQISYDGKTILPENILTNPEVLRNPVKSVGEGVELKDLDMTKLVENTFWFIFDWFGF